MSTSDDRSDRFGGYTLEELLGAKPILVVEKKPSLVGRIVAAPFRLIGAIVMLPVKIVARLIGAVTKLVGKVVGAPFRLLGAALGSGRQGDNS